MSITRPKESKIHPAIIAYKAFYNAQTLIENITTLISEDKKAELEFPIRIGAISPTEEKALSEWSRTRYVDKLENPENTDLTRREKTWIGFMYKLGLGVARNTEKATQFFQQAAKENDGLALHQLNDFFMAREKGCLLAINDSALAEKDLNKRLKLYEEGNMAGDARSTFNLGNHFLRAGLRFLSPDFAYTYINNRELTQAYEFFVKGSERGCHRALVNLAIMYAAGYHVSTNKDISVQLLETVLEKNPTDNTALDNIRNINPNKAAKYYRYSIEQGNQTAVGGLISLLRYNDDNPIVVYHTAIALGVFKKDTPDNHNVLPMMSNLLKDNPSVFSDLIAGEKEPQYIQEGINSLLMTIKSEARPHTFFGAASANTATAPAKKTHNRGCCC